MLLINKLKGINTTIIILYYTIIICWNYSYAKLKRNENKVTQQPRVAACVALFTVRSSYKEKRGRKGAGEQVFPHNKRIKSAV